MIVSRMVSLFLRFAQFVCSAIVLGLVAYFLHQRDKYGVGPLGRSIYTEIVAALSVIFSLIWMIPTTSSIINYATDLFFSAAWFVCIHRLFDNIDTMLTVLQRLHSVPSSIGITTSTAAPSGTGEASGFAAETTAANGTPHRPSLSLPPSSGLRVSFLGSSCTTSFRALWLPMALSKSFSVFGPCAIC